VKKELRLQSCFMPELVRHCSKWNFIAIQELPLIMQDFSSTPTVGYLLRLITSRPKHRTMMWMRFVPSFSNSRKLPLLCMRGGHQCNHKPSRLLRNAQRAGDFVRTDSVLQFTINQTAIIHLSMPSAESSKMVPTLTVNCFLHPLQNQRRRVEMKECSVDSQRGQVTLPVGQRRDTA